MIIGSIYTSDNVTNTFVAFLSNKKRLKASSPYEQGFKYCIWCSIFYTSRIRRSFAYSVEGNYDLISPTIISPERIWNIVQNAIGEWKQQKREWAVSVDLLCMSYIIIIIIIMITI